MDYRGLSLVPYMNLRKSILMTTIASFFYLEGRIDTFLE